MDTEILNQNSSTNNSQLMFDEFLPQGENNQIRSYLSYLKLTKNEIEDLKNYYNECLSKHSNQENLNSDGNLAYQSLKSPNLQNDIDSDIKLGYKGFLPDGSQSTDYGNDNNTETETETDNDDTDTNNSINRYNNPVPEDWYAVLYNNSQPYNTDYGVCLSREALGYFKTSDPTSQLQNNQILTYGTNLREEERENLKEKFDDIRNAFYLKDEFPKEENLKTLNKNVS